MVNHYLTPGAIIDSSHTWDEVQTFAVGVAAGTAPLRAQNTTSPVAPDAASNLGFSIGGGARGGSALNNDEVYMSMLLDNSTTSQVEAFRMTTKWTTVTAGGEMTDVEFYALRGGSLNLVFKTDGSAQRILYTYGTSHNGGIRTDAIGNTSGNITIDPTANLQIDGPLLLTSSIFAEGGSPTEGAVGEQLTSAGAGTVVIWAAAGSQAAVKDIHGYLEPQEALDAVTRVAVPRWHYRREREDGSRAATTGDYATEYAGVLAEDFPEVMHHEGRIFSPVSAFGYAVGAIQALEARLRIVEEQSWQ